MIGGVSVTSSAGQVSSSYAVSNLTNASGLSTPVSFTSTHNNTFSNMWIATSLSDNLVFNLGQSYALNQVGIWNYNYSPPSSTALSRGVRGFSIDASTDGINYASVLTAQTLNKANGGSESSQLFNLNGTTAQFIRLNYTSNYGSTSQTGLSEVQFDGASVSAVPEPLTILGAVIAAGFGAGFKRKLAKSKKDEKDA